MSSPYTYIHEPNVYDGTIANIRVRWQASAIRKLVGDAAEAGVPMETLKKVSEHFGFLLAHRLGSTQALIRSGPHKFTMDSRTNATSADGDHITVEVSGGMYGKRKCHVYLSGHGVGAEQYDNVEAEGESVMEKTVARIDASLSEGNINGVLYGTAATMYGEASGNAGLSSWGAAYGTAGVSGGATASSSASYTAWEWDQTYQARRRFNYSTQQWEWYQG